MRKLFIFGGQRRRDDYLNDFFTYSVDTDDVEIISTGNALEGGVRVRSLVQLIGFDI